MEESGLKQGLNDVLEALLYRRADREAFLAGDLARFGLSDEDTDALRTIDPEQLVSAAKLAREHVLSRSHRGVGSLVQAFPETIQAWQAAHPGCTLDDLAEELVASPPFFEAYRTNAFAGKGIALEEAFFRFAEQASLGTHAVRFREYARALLRGLSVTPDPVFAIPDLVRRAPKGLFVVDPTTLTLFAILGGKVIEGPLTPYIAAILTSAEVPAALMPETREEEQAVRSELVRLGLIA
jgi:hypothetical protein